LPEWRDRADALRGYAELFSRALHDPEPGTRVTVAEDHAGTPLGLTLLYGPPENPGVFVKDLAVSEAAKGLGVARALMDDARAFAREVGAPELGLKVNAANARARAFYAREGFREEYLYLSREP
ncbi:GNAT family N-acetyltransferase, partial [Deinococcus pimensis]|uniref:GNAT family N-acetyltransferase n=1 Tax=Deinococcus pimensis TaxID=309888 RepID=UPI0012F8DD56